MSTVAPFPELKLFPITPCPDLMKILATDFTQYTNVIYATAVARATIVIVIKTHSISTSCNSAAAKYDTIYDLCCFCLAINNSFMFFSPSCPFLSNFRDDRMSSAWLLQIHTPSKLSPALTQPNNSQKQPTSCILFHPTPSQKTNLPFVFLFHLLNIYNMFRLECWNRSIGLLLLDTWSAFYLELDWLFGQHT